MINLDDVEDGITELERAARLGLAGAMITEYPLEHRRYDQSEYEPFWAAAEALDLPLGSGPLGESSNVALASESVANG